MKTAISIPDELFRRADKLARRLGKSRSRLYQDALAAYLVRDSEDLTQAMDNALADIQPQSDPWVNEASRLTLERSEW